MEQDKRSQYLTEYLQYKENMSFLNHDPEQAKWTLEKVKGFGAVKFIELLNGQQDVITWLDGVVNAIQEGASDWENDCKALQAKCDKYETALNNIVNFPENQWHSKAVKNIANKALSAEERERKLTAEEVAKRKEAIEWYRNPAGQQDAVWVKGNYGRLYDQLKAEPERKIVCWVDYSWNFKDANPVMFRDICTVRGEKLEFVSRGHGYGGADLMIGWDDEKKYFLQECERLRVEWLDESGK